MPGVLLQVKDLKTYFYTAQSIIRAVDGISYDVCEGETMALVGESGCGKSVSALSLLRLVPYPGRIVGGQVIFDGEDLLKASAGEVKRIRGRHIAMVFQEPMTSLNPVFTVGDQIGEAISVHEDVNQTEIQERCVQLLTDVGIDSPEQRLKDYPHQLSGGQLQRVMIAMALACNPDLVIADEPTTALDVTIQAQIINLFSQLQERRHMSLLYITHDLRVVARIADRIYVMYAGVIVEQGGRSEIFFNACHPYTQGLLASLPDRAKRGTKLQSIPGTVPDPAYKPRGCPFHPRCGFALASCREAFPQMCDHGKGHLSRCPVLHNKEMQETNNHA